MAQDVIKLRKLAGWPQLRLAYKTDIALARLAAIERGTVTPTPEEWASIEAPLLLAIAAKREELDAAIEETRNHPGPYPSGRSTALTEVSV